MYIGSVIPFLLDPLDVEPVLLHGDLWVSVFDVKSRIYPPFAFAERQHRYRRLRRAHHLRSIIILWSQRSRVSLDYCTQS